MIVVNKKLVPKADWTRLNRAFYNALHVNLFNLGKDEALRVRVGERMNVSTVRHCVKDSATAAGFKISTLIAESSVYIFVLRKPVSLKPIEYANCAICDKRFAKLNYNSKYCNPECYKEKKRREARDRDKMSRTRSSESDVDRGLAYQG